MNITIKTNKNDLIAWVSILGENNENLGDVYLPPKISNDDLIRASQHIKNIWLVAYRIGHITGKREVQTQIKSALSL